MDNKFISLGVIIFISIVCGFPVALKTRVTEGIC